MKYIVKTHELQWYNCRYTVEADSEEEVQELVESGFAEENDSYYDTTDQIDFESIETIE